MTWDFSTEPEFEGQLAWMRSFLRDEVMPLEVLDLGPDEADRLLRPLQQQVKDQGLWAAHLSRDLGGQGFGQVKLGLMHEIIGQSFYGPFVFGNQAPDSGNSEILALWGTPEQKRRWLQPLLDGEYRSCFLMTEPGAGADPTMLSARAVRDGDTWVVDGDKWFATHASIADFFLAMVVTDPDAEPHRRASIVIFDADTPGVQVGREIVSLDRPSVAHGEFDLHFEVTLSGLRVPADQMLGGEGDGFRIAQDRLGPGRIHHCMRWIGQAHRAFDMLCERATYRYAHGSVLADKQTVQNWVADSAAEIDAARLMVLHAAWKADTSGFRAARREISMIKYWVARVLHDIIDRALQLHGSLGYSADLPLEEMYRRARAARIYDGPDEVHRQSVARSILKDYAPPPGGVPTEHVPTRRAEAERRFARLLELPMDVRRADDEPDRVSPRAVSAIHRVDAGLRS